MCGIAGFLDANRRSNTDFLANVAKRMTDAIAHRGPDDSGIWSDPSAGIAIGNRRLAVLDLSAAGHQPMISNSGRYVIVYNGEVYNYQDICSEIQKESGAWIPRGHSDTEVILAAIERWGVVNAVKRFNGMFAFAVWDRNCRELWLARDQFGKKPLYYGWSGSSFLFGSELKALRAHPDFDSEINREALPLYFRLNCVPAPYSIYKKIRKLPAASVLKITGKLSDPGQLFTYWSLADLVKDGLENPWSGTLEEAKLELKKLLIDAVKLRLVSDVDLGLFLSGGIDSSIVAAFAQQLSSRLTRTFSIGLRDNPLDESRHAEKVAEHLGCEHTSLYVGPNDALNLVPSLSVIYDEPFSDSSQIPTLLVSQLAKRTVTVTLSGDGGDEIFGGYNRHITVSKIWRVISRVPLPARTFLSNVMTSISPPQWDRAYGATEKFIPRNRRFSMPGYKIHKLASLATSGSPQDIYVRLISHWEKNEIVPTEGNEKEVSFVPGAHDSFDITNQMMLLDACGYLHDDILVKLDRATMAVSLEARCPLLDTRIASFAWRLPLDWKIRGGIGKWILRQILYDYVPRDLVDRPKSGFGVPIDDWLRGPLRDWAESLLDETRLRNQGYLVANVIREKWTQHMSGNKNWAYHLWDALMFQSWLENVGREWNSSTNLQDAPEQRLSCAAIATPVIHSGS